MDTRDRKTHLRFAMAQLDLIDGDVDENVRRAQAAVRKAKKKGAEFVCLPEAADFGWLCQHARRDAFSVPGTYSDIMSYCAREFDVWISAGCLEKDQDKTYNSAIIIDRQGQIVLKHRKINTLPEITEHLYDAGRFEDIRTVDTEYGRIGLTICADNFSPEIPKRVAELGAWLLIAPHGFAAEEADLPSNAQEYRAHICRVASGAGLWVVACDTALSLVAGGAWKGRPHSGCSIVADPCGNAVAVGKFKEPDLVIYDVPLPE